MMLVDAPGSTAVCRFDDASLLNPAVDDERVARMKHDCPQRPTPRRIRQRPICRLGQTPDMQTFPGLARVATSEELRRFNSEVDGPWLTARENDCPYVFDIEPDMVPIRA